MAETLRARDSGDLNTAKAKAEELIKLAPSDANVQRLNASITQEIERRDGGGAMYGLAPTTAEHYDEVPGTETETAAQSLVDRAASVQEANLDAAGAAIDEAMQLAELGAYSDAINLLNQAAGGLPLNTSTAGMLEDLQDAKASSVFRSSCTG